MLNFSVDYRNPFLRIDMEEKCKNWLWHKKKKFTVLDLSLFCHNNL